MKQQNVYKTIIIVRDENIQHYFQLMHYQEFSFSTAASHLYLTEDRRLIDEGNDCKMK